MTEHKPRAMSAREGERCAVQRPGRVALGWMAAACLAAVTWAHAASPGASAPVATAAPPKPAPVQGLSLIHI